LNPFLTRVYGKERNGIVEEEICFQGHSIVFYYRKENGILAKGYIFSAPVYLQTKKQTPWS
jgi:hypothetical protein